MKDTIEVTLENGTIEEMEVVFTFKLEGYSYNYLIYKKKDKTKYYIAKYEGENTVKLNTDFTEKELKLAEAILEGVVASETRNR